MGNDTVNPAAMKWQYALPVSKTVSRNDQKEESIIYGYRLFNHTGTSGA